MEVESGGDSGAAGSSGQSGIDRGESRGDMVGGGSYAEEDDELMLEYMGNEGVGSEEIDKFMGELISKVRMGSMVSMRCVSSVQEPWRRSPAITERAEQDAS